jgi:hypothetical protein
MDATIMNREGIEVGLQDLMFSQQDYWGFKASGMWHFISEQVVSDT